MPGRPSLPPPRSRFCADTAAEPPATGSAARGSAWPIRATETAHGLPTARPTSLRPLGAGPAAGTAAAAPQRPGPGRRAPASGGVGIAAPGGITGRGAYRFTHSGASQPDATGAAGPGQRIRRSTQRGHRRPLAGAQQAGGAEPRTPSVIDALPARIGGASPIPVSSNAARHASCSCRANAAGQHVSTVRSRHGSGQVLPCSCPGDSTGWAQHRDAHADASQPDAGAAAGPSQPNRGGPRNGRKQPSSGARRPGSSEPCPRCDAGPGIGAASWGSRWAGRITDGAAAPPGRP